MSGKAKFDQEAAFKSIIGAGREPEEEMAEKFLSKGKNANRVQRSYFLDRDICLLYTSPSPRDRG